MNNNIYLYILVMATVTYVIRLVPLTLIRKEINNDYIKSFLYFIPYVTLSVMTFPAILHSTGNMWSALSGFLVAMFLAYKEQNLFRVSLFACITVFIVELII